MRRLTSGIRSEKWSLGEFVVVRTSQSVLNTNLDSISNYTPRLYGI